jgi:hypothetical protein
MLLVTPVGAVTVAAPVVDEPFGGPLFGLATAPDDSLLVADSGAGIFEIRKGKRDLVVALPGVSDVAPIGRGSMFAVTGGDTPGGKLYRVSRGEGAVEIADLAAYERDVNPVKPEVNPNAFDVAVLTGGKALVADAGGNDLLIVDMKGHIDWVATFPDQLVSTANGKTLVGCPNPIAPDLAFVCDLPEMVPSQPVPTSIAIGPDGAYYVGELKGFPGPIGASRIWRIQPGALHAECGVSPACSVVADGFTSIVDLNFGPDGTLYVTEIDEASFLAVELGTFFGIPGLTAGGTVNACNSTSWACTVVKTNLPIPTATATDSKGNLYATVSALIPNQAQVVQLP